MISVAKLIQILEGVEDKSRKVVLAKDPEGNGYSFSCSDYSESRFKQGELVETGGYKCVVLWPED